MSSRLALLLLFALSACGIKAPPRPPLDEPASASPALLDVPDAGCPGCREEKR